MLGLVSKASLEEVEKALEAEKSFRKSDASRMADILAGEKAKLAQANASLEAANQALAQLESVKVAEQRRHQEAMDFLVRSAESKLVALQASYNALRTVFETEAAQHVICRTEAHSEAMAHAETAERLSDLLRDHADLKKAHGDAVSQASQARSQADAEVEAARQIIKKRQES